eukprot:1162080-Pelagomonas_calceolata.AAC.9
MYWGREGGTSRIVPCLLLAHKCGVQSQSSSGHPTFNKEYVYCYRVLLITFVLLSRFLTALVLALGCILASHSPEFSNPGGMPSARWSEMLCRDLLQTCHTIPCAIHIFNANTLGFCCTGGMPCSAKTFCKPTILCAIHFLNASTLGFCETGGMPSTRWSRMLYQNFSLAPFQARHPAFTSE